MRACFLRLLLLLVWQIAAAAPAWAAEPLPVGFETREFVDEARSNWLNTGLRPLSTVIWYPAAGDAPLTVPQTGDPASRPYFVQRQFAVKAPLSTQASALRKADARSNRAATATVSTACKRTS